MNQLRAALLAAALVPLAPGTAPAQQTPAPPPVAAPAAYGTPDGLVADLYRTVSFPAGRTADWERVRSMFLPGAVIFLRTSRTASTAFTVEGFIDDFVTFSARADVMLNGFSERVVKMKPTVYRDVAHVLVLYEAQVPNSQRGPQLGIDSFHVVRKDGRWWIAGIVNEIVAPDEPLPAALRD